MKPSTSDDESTWEPLNAKSTSEIAKPGSSMIGSQKDAMLSKTSLSPVSAGELAILLAPSTSLPMTADRKAIKDDIRRMRDGFITAYGHRGSPPDFYLSQVLSSYLSQEEMRQMIIEVWSEK